MITFVGEVASTARTTAATTVVLTFTAPVAFGDVIVIVAAAFQDTAYSYSITDNAAGGPNVYEAPPVGTAAAFAVVTHPFSIGDTITITGVSRDAAVATVLAFRGLGWTLTSALQALMTEQNIIGGFALTPGLVGPNAPFGDSYIFQPGQANDSVINFPPTNVDTTMTGLPVGYGGGVVVAGSLWSLYGPGVTSPTTLALINDFLSGYTPLGDPADIAVDYGTLVRATNTNGNAVVHIPYFKIIPVSAAAYSQFINPEVIDNVSFKYAYRAGGHILPSPFAVDAGFLPQIGAG